MRRLGPAVVLGASAAAVLALLVTAGPSIARSSAGTTTTPVARSVPAPRPIMPRTGKPFIPALGDWEGTANGYPASFQLSYDAALHRTSRLPSYGIVHVVGLLPNTCPPVASHYGESLVDSAIPSLIGRYGALGLARLGFDGLFNGKRVATMSRGYAAGSCRGKLTWKMHPSTRMPVDTGGWKLRFADGQTSTFKVLGGGRLVADIAIPRALTKCNGARGSVDLFIEPNGKAAISQTLVRLSMRFSRRTASGQVSAGGGGCARRPTHFTATARGR